MIPLSDISDGINTARLYNISQFKKLRADLEKGVRHCSFGNLICINQWIKALQYDVGLNINNDKTQAIYKLLMQSINGFGASYTIDPNVRNPGQNIIVNSISDGKPDWIDVPWLQMTNDIAGYRDTYFNADWIGLNPMIQIEGVTMYKVGVDYNNDGNGTITFITGKGLYDGQYFRAGNYQTYTP